MTNNAGAATQETPPRNPALFAEAGVKSTPQEMNFAVATEYISTTLGAEVDNAHPSIVQNFEKCEPDTILQVLHTRCTGLNRVFKPGPRFSGKAMTEDTQVDLKLYLKFDKCAPHISIRGRATSVSPAKSKLISGPQLDPHFESPEPVAKLYWPEDTHQSEPNALYKFCNNAETDPDALGHVPGLVLFRKFNGTSTSKIRITSGLQDAEQAKPGNRVITIIVFRKLLPITVLAGKEFLAAWWQIVKCHRALWKIGVHHRNVNPSNLTGYRVCDQFIGVLNDYDLSLCQRDSPSSLERTGTVPFMAIRLLAPEAITGKVEHVYTYDAESFIWTLTWVCLRYEGGNLLSKNRPLEEWLTLDAIQCSKEKAYFCWVGLSRLHPSESHKESWDLIMKCFVGIQSLYTPLGYRKLGDQSTFELLLEDPMQGLL